MDASKKVHGLIGVMTGHMHTCIYCRTVGPESVFSTEHVIPKAFGTFGTDTLVLNNCVTSDCNQFFGDTLEVIVSRGSLEAIERFKGGLKPLVEIADVRLDRIACRLAADDPFKGAKLVFVPTDRRLRRLLLTT